MSTLRNCPFCGGEVTKPDRGFDARYRVECHRCNFEGPPEWSADKAIELWNTRAPVEMTDAECVLATK